jgi:CRISPR-associated protein Csd1
MSWLSKLCVTYEKAQQLEISDELKPLPISHTLQNAHIKVTIDAQGNFKRAEVLEKTQIVLPATEKSAGRSSGEAPHPLADKIQYVAGDYAKFGGRKKAYYEGYLKQLSDWCNSQNFIEQVRAVKTYVKKGVLISDLVKSGILFLDDKGELLISWPEDSDQEVPKLFKILPKENKKLDQGSALVCWNVEGINFLTSETWLNPDIQKAWILYDTQNAGKNSFCYVTGQEQPAASNHPAKLRHTGDKAKLISSNDLDGFTFKGRFTDTKKSIETKGLQGASISYEVTQKAHNALRWLITRQGYRNGNQAIVAWAVSCKDIPEPMNMSLDLMEEYEAVIDHSIDLGKKFGRELKKLISGYKAKLDSRDNIIILGLDSATPGRMGITYYQELKPDEYLDRIEQWHNDFAWFQRVKFDESKERYHRWPISTPSPRAIFEAIFGTTISDSLKKKTLERLLPCIVDGLPFPSDLMQGAVRQAVNRQSYQRDKQWLWEKNLGVACALFKGFQRRQKRSKEYEMGLEKNNSNRDYLFGRLLAIAEKIEETALYVAGESRNTTAARLMQRFADRPASTWRNIELALNPYIQRLKVSRGGFLHNIQMELDEIMSMFESSEFILDKPLGGEFLLAFHAQRLELNKKKEDRVSTQSDSVK